MELVRDNVKVEWDAIGEGLQGDYNSENSDDVELLRFYVSVLRDGEWEEKEDGSYCTCFPVTATDKEKWAGLLLLMDRFHDVLFSDPDASIKKLGEEMSWINPESVSQIVPGIMDLGEFLDVFDFDYDVVSPGDKYEMNIRKNLIELGDLDASNIDKDLICLIDKQGAYLGDIDRERYPLTQSSVAKIIERMNIYVWDYVFEEFEDALAGRGIDTSCMDISEMMAKCKELGVGSDEVSYTLADVIVDPSRIFIPELCSPEKSACLEENIDLILSSIQPDRFTSSTNSVLSFDSIKEIDVVCVDICYNNSKYLPACDVVNLIQLPLSEDNIQFARQVLSSIADQFQIPVRDELDGSLSVTEESLEDKIQAALSTTPTRGGASGVVKDPVIPER